MDVTGNKMLTTPVFREFGSLQRTSRIFANVEKFIKVQEDKFSYIEFIEFVGRFSQELIFDHVGKHRDFIRTNDWPNHTYESSHEKFLHDFELSSMAYARVSFRIIKDLNGESSWVNIHDEVVFTAEALRGQFGKRSPTGLDARLEKYESELDAILANVSSGLVEDIIYLFCTPSVRGCPSAEDIFCIDFLDLVAEFPKLPDLKLAIGAEEKKLKIFKRFMRRHAKWNMALLAHIYKSTSIKDIKENLATRNTDILKDKIACTLRSLEQELSSSQIDQLVTTTHYIAELNHLNLTLEPIYSFKGAVGLVQLATYLHQEGREKAFEGLNQKKWQLFKEERKNYDRFQ